MPETVMELGRKVKAKYPGKYDDLPDAEVGRKVKAKFPGDYEDFIEIPTASESGRLSLGGGTEMSAQRTFMEKVVGAAPEFVGQIVGGIAGAPGGLPGVLAGGTIGAAGGRAAKTLGAKTGIAPRVFGKAPESRMETAQEIGEAGVYGGATELLGGGLSRLIPKGAMRKLRPDQVRDIAILEREGIPYTAGDIRPGQMAQQVENLTRGTFLGGKVIEEHSRRQAVALDQFRTKVLNNIGPYLSKEESGRVLQKTVEQTHQELMRPGGTFSRLYGKFSRLYKAPVDTASIRAKVAPIKAELDALTAEGRIGAAAKSKEAPSRLIEIVDRLATFGTQKTQPQAASTVLGPTGQPMRAAIPAGQKQLPLTYADVWQDKQALDATIRSMSMDDPLRTKAKGLLNRLHTILDEGMEEAAKKVNPMAASRIRKVNSAYRSAKELYETESLVSEISKMDPERVVDRFFPKGATTAPKELLAAIKSKPGVKPILKRRVIENLFESIGQREYQDVPVVSGKVLEAKFKSMRPTLQSIMSPPELAAVDDFINAAKRAQMSQTMVNPASGRQMLALSQAGNVISLVGGGMLIGYGDPAKGAVAIFAPSVIARALVNPSIARMLATGFRIPTAAREFPAWAARAVNALRAIEAEESEVEPQ